MKRKEDQVSLTGYTVISYTCPTTSLITQKQTQHVSIYGVFGFSITDLHSSSAEISERPYLSCISTHEHY